MFRALSSRSVFPRVFRSLTPGHRISAAAASQFKGGPFDMPEPKNYLYRIEADGVDETHETDNRVFKMTQEDNRIFQYMMVGAARVAYLSLGRAVVLKLVNYLSAAKDTVAAGSIEVNVSEIPVGTTATVLWRGKPVFISHRSPECIDHARSEDATTMRDPQPDAERALNPEFLIVLGVCTHLGCVPLPDQGNWGKHQGWFCPCHGSHYDGAGRIRIGPAPLNLEIPPYKFLSDTVIQLG